VGSWVASLLPSATMGSFSVFMTFLLGIKFIVRPVMTTKEAMQGISAKKRAIQSIVCGVIIGLIWGYVRSLDRFFTELYNLIDNVPYIIYMTLIALVVGQSFTIMAVSMIAIGWLVMARRVRNMVFMFRDREYNLASRCLGTPLWRVLTKNILPYLVSVIILRMALSIPATINLESTLSYLGIGLGIETPSLGLILSKVRGFFLDYPYLLVFPASIVSIISISFYIMGNAFSDAADPRNHV